MKRVAFILAFISIAFTSFSQYKPTYYHGWGIVSVETIQEGTPGDTISTNCPDAFIHEFNKYIVDANIKYLARIEPIPADLSREDLHKWFSECRKFQVYCIGDILVTCDSTNKKWHYEMIDYKSNYIKWTDTWYGRRVSEVIIDKNGNLIRNYQYDPKLGVYCFGKGCK